jgi:hypothetical protein
MAAETFTERARERGYRVVDEDGDRHVTVERGGVLYGMTIYSTIDPSPDRWEAVLKNWDELLGGKMPAP